MSIVKNAVFAVATAGLLVAVQAHAALPEAVSTAITTAGTDLAAAAGLVIAGLAGFWGLRKLGGKMGWW